MQDFITNIFINTYFINMVILAISGFLIRTSLVLSGQKWANTYHHLATYIFLPVTGYLITTIIKGDLALSLGMIGALSIVRFRTPVKSPLELVMFFALITIGIGVAVNYKLSVLLTFIIIFLITLFTYVQKYYKDKDKTFISSSYDEGTVSHTLEVKSKSKISLLEKSKNLEGYYFNKQENSYNYRLVFTNKLDLDSIKVDLEKNADIEFIDIKYAL